MSPFDDLTAIQPQELAAGYLARAVHGERLTLAIVEVEPDAELAEHHHANEQFGLVLRGALILRVGDEERTVAPGGLWRIPGDTPHSAKAGPEGAVVVDVFSPPRHDWSTIAATDPRRPGWP